MYAFELWRIPYGQGRGKCIEKYLKFADGADYSQTLSLPGEQSSIRSS